MPDDVPGPSNLWLADTLWRLGAVQFGDFTLGRTTVHSPIYINLRLLIAHPTALARAAHIILQELTTLQAMRNPQVDPFDLVCGVPFGGLASSPSTASGLRPSSISTFPSGLNLVTMFEPSSTVQMLSCASTRTECANSKP